jgi:RNA exonuclease 1
LRPSLKYLAARWLNRIIQSDENTLIDNLVVGHDSCVDAATSMELVRLKLARGPDFGLYFSSTESIFSRLERCRPFRLGAIFETLGSTRPSSYTKHAKVVRRCETDNQLVDEVIDAIGSYDFVWASLHDPSLNQLIFESRIQPPVSPTLTSEDAKTSRYWPTPTHPPSSLSCLDGYVQKIWSNLPAGTVLVVIGATKVDDRIR